MKDLGWMTTNVYLGWLFGSVAVILHVLVLVIDWPFNVTFRFYHCSLVLWIIGNFLWMSVEFMVYKESSDIHFGPHTPVGGISMDTGDRITVVKSYFFLAGIFIQLLLFALIHLGWLEMPTDGDSDGAPDDSGSEGRAHCGEGRSAGRVVRRRSNSRGDEAHLVDHSHNSSSGLSDASAGDESGESTGDDGLDRMAFDHDDIFHADIEEHHPLGFTLAFIENSYIVLWISKDYFWSWATGDFEVQRGTGYFTVLLYAYITYAWRKHYVNMMDSLTSWCWLFANFVWMAGEIFIRYDNLELDDLQQANDTSTRLVSGLFFLIGLQLQCLVIFHIMIRSLKERAREGAEGQHFELIPVSSADDLMGVNGAFNVQEDI